MVFMSLARPFSASFSLPQLRVLGASVLSGLLLIGAPAHAQQASDNVRWVSDSLNTYVRSGPTEGYRIAVSYTHLTLPTNREV